MGHRFKAEGIEPSTHGCVVSMTFWIHQTGMQGERNVLEYSQVGKQRVILEYIAKPTLLRAHVNASPMIKQGRSFQSDMAFAGRAETSNHL
jgi:hypothetical protein